MNDRIDMTTFESNHTNFCYIEVKKYDFEITKYFVEKWSKCFFMRN